MKLIDQSVKLTTITDKADYIVEKMGRKCYGSQMSDNKVSRDAFLLGLIKSGHESVVEHTSATVEITSNLRVLEQITRHRLASFSVQSTRYVNFKKGIICIRPVWMIHHLPGEYNNITTADVCHDQSVDFHAERIYLNSLIRAEGEYKALLAHGRKAEEASDILPKALATEIGMTANFREWRHVIKLRTSKKAHPQIRAIVKDIAILLSSEYPVFFSDLVEGFNE